MLSYLEILRDTWATKVASLAAMASIPTGLVFASIVAPFLLLPVLLLLCMTLAMVGFSLLDLHRTFSASVPGYDVRVHLYPLLKWAFVHAAVSIAPFPIIYLLVDKILPILFVPVLGASAAVYAIFLATQVWVARMAEREVAEWPGGPHLA